MILGEQAAALAVETKSGSKRELNLVEDGFCPILHRDGARAVRVLESTLDRYHAYPPMDSNLCPKRLPDLQVNEVADGIVVSLPGQDRIHFLNTTAAFILECCDGRTSRGELPGLVASAFGLELPPDQDVENCVTALVNAGLLETDRS